MKKIIICISIIICAMMLCSCEKNATSGESVNNSTVNNKKNNKGENNSMGDFTSKINITINNKNYSVTLEDNETSRDFIKKLPLNIKMNELNGNEKYYYFTEDLPSNSIKIDSIKAGDIMLYGSDCLVLFYDTFKTSYSYTRIGKIDDPSDIKDAVGNGKINVYISR